MKCSICECEKTYVKSYEHSYTVKGKIIKFISDRRFCENCNQLVYDAELDNKASAKAISEYSKQYGITKEQIIDLRKNYGLSQELFSKVIGCAKKTLVSYEKGKSIPNDSYLIILKSLILNPKTIITIIESNREQFTNEEFERIKNKLDHYFSQDGQEISVKVEFRPSEYNGYTRFSQEKMYNIILFFSENTILKTKLLKEMFYADFLYFKHNCKSITGLEYAKLTYGPVPEHFEDILSKGQEEGLISYKVDYVNAYECHNICAKKKYNKELFDEEEFKVLQMVKDKFKDFSSKDMVEFSHKEKAFLESEFYKKISYDYAFEIVSI